MEVRIKSQEFTQPKQIMLILTRSQNCLNGSHDFISIHNCGSKNEIARIYKSETNSLMLILTQ